MNVLVHVNVNVRDEYLFSRAGGMKVGTVSQHQISAFGSPGVEIWLVSVPSVCRLVPCQGVPAECLGAFTSTFRFTVWLPTVLSDARVLRRG